MFARRIVAKHVTKTTALAMLGATAVLSGLQVLFTYLGELGSLKKAMARWMPYGMCSGVRPVICMKFSRLPH